jgi:hypothetical protein
MNILLLEVKETFNLIDDVPSENVGSGIHCRDFLTYFTQLMQ